MNECPMWTERSLGSVATITMGQSPPSSTVTEGSASAKLPFLQGNAEFGDLHPSPKNACLVALRSCRPDDASISVRAPVGATNRADQSYCIGRGLAAISFTTIDRNFGWHALLHAAPALRTMAQGTTFEAIGKNELASLALPVPTDSGEQQRIAEILDTVDDAIRSTERLIENLDQVRLFAYSMAASSLISSPVHMV
jgi:type I restriction enzyme, S subunit